MARASKPDPAAHEGRPSRAARPRASVRHAKPEPEAAPDTVEPAQPAEAEAAGIAVATLEIAAVDAPGLEAAGGEPPADAMPPVANPPETAAPGPPAAAAEPADLAAAPGEGPDLHGLTLRFWQAQLERTMAAGQAIMLCRSPQAAARLQIGYVQASLASGLAHAGEVARLSQRIARDTLPSHHR